MDDPDLDVLVLHARRALTCTADATLLIAGVACSTGHSVLLYEDDGEPRFLCEEGSLVVRASAVRRTATLDVGCCRRSRCRRRVVFTGRLTLRGTDEIDGTPVHIVGLALDAIRVHRPLGGPIDVPVSRYHRRLPDTEPDTSEAALAEYAARIVEHTNHAHGVELREAAAAIAGLPPDDLLAAQIHDVRSSGFTMRWVAGDGGHECPVSFVRSATSAVDLAALLRAALH